MNRAKLKMLLVMLIFIFPVLAGTLLYHFREDFHFKKSNHGTLITPVVDVGSLWKTDGKWQIVYVPQTCPTAADQKTMFLLHQLRIILGNDSRRASLVLIVDKSCQKVEAHDFQKITFSEKQFAIIPKNKIYLVDPKSNLFMSYPNGSDLMNVYHDLKRVLEVSQIG